MSLVVLDTHVLQWWSAEPDRLSAAAGEAIDAATEVGVAAISWFEMAWLARHDRITVAVPVHSWLQRLGSLVRTLPLTPAVADTAASLPASFGGDPADRLIYATAVEHGCSLVTKDRRMHRHRHPRPVTLW